MGTGTNINELADIIQELETEISRLKSELSESNFALNKEKLEKDFYQLVSDFAFGWELWFAPQGQIKYCSPSCFDLTGFTANQIVASKGIEELLVYETDKQKFGEFLSLSLNQVLASRMFEFRILTRTKQLRWCNMNVRGVYDKMGKYLGIRASVQDITRLKKAMGQIQEMSVVKEFEEKAKQRLRFELDSKERELVSFLLQLSQKNELLAKVSIIAKEAVSKGKKDSKLHFESILQVLEQNNPSQVDWSSIENQIEKTHPDFFYRLKTRHPSITVKDKKLCAYIRLGLSSKDISGLQNITPRSVEIARVRLRKKLQLPTSVRLMNYLEKL